MRPAEDGDSRAQKKKETNMVYPTIIRRSFERFRFGNVVSEGKKYLRPVARCRFLYGCDARQLHSQPVGSVYIVVPSNLNNDNSNGTERSDALIETRCFFVKN